MKMLWKKTVILILTFSILSVYFTSCSLTPKETIPPTKKLGLTKWLKLSPPHKTAQAITERDLMLIKEKMNESKAAKIRERIKALFSTDEVVMDITFSDLDGDSKEEALAIIGRSHKKYGKRLLILSLEDEKIWKDIDITELNPWRIEAGDIDGDGKNEVLVGVYKRTRFDPERKNRLFVYDWYQDDLFPKWLGSSLSLPFYDFALGDVDGEGKDELVSLEWLKDGGSRVMIYKWSGFGFLGEWQANSLESIQNLMLFDSDNDGKEEIFIER
jgi:hypothetical protein